MTQNASLTCLLRVVSTGSGRSGRSVQNPSASCFPAGRQADRATGGRLPHSVRQSRTYISLLFTECIHLSLYVHEPRFRLLGVGLQNQQQVAPFVQPENQKKMMSFKERQQTGWKSDICVCLYFHNGTSVITNPSY